MGQHVIISGCSSGGKSSLLEALRRRGEIVVEEPGRRIVTEELASGGTALPWVDATAFVRRAIELSRSDLRSIDPGAKRVFFDRGLIDAAVGLQHLVGEPIESALGQQRFHRQVFIAPPWPDIYETDEERPHGFDEAVAEYERLTAAYPRLGYEIVSLPKVNVDDRADFVLSVMSGSERPQPWLEGH